MKENLIPIETITGKIFLIRDQRVMLDRDLAILYDVTTSNFNKAVKRNTERFPKDFMFQLTKEEFESLRFQIGTSKKRGGIRYMPYAFTEQGVSMLSAILNSPKAIETSVRIIRAFVQLKKIVVENVALKYAIEGLEKRVGKNERHIQIALQYMQKILFPEPKPEPKPKIKKKIKMGFTKD